jgi:hypothetical protein
LFVRTPVHQVIACLQPTSCVFAIGINFLCKKKLRHVTVITPDADATMTVNPFKCIFGRGDSGYPSELDVAAMSYR